MQIRSKFRHLTVSKSARFGISFIAFFSYILLFAAYYSLVLHGHFRFEGIPHEDSYKKTKSEIAQYISRALLSETNLVDQVIQASQAAFQREDLVSLQLSLSISDIEPGVISFEGSYGLLNDEAVSHTKALEECQSSMFASHTFEYDCFEKLFSSPNAESAIWIPVGSCFLIPETIWGLYTTFYCMAEGERNDIFFHETGSNFGLYTGLPENKVREMMSFSRASTHLERGLFLRMLYLSAVTATTLGYGDITPITTTARLSVAVQSVCGLFLMGLFVFWLTSNENTPIKQHKGEEFISDGGKVDTGTKRGEGF